MTIGDIIEDVRSRLMDKTQPYLWSDAELVDYANESINELCREGRMIKDNISPLCSITLQPGIESYPLHESIWAVQEHVSLFYEGQQFLLPRSDITSLNDLYPDWRVKIVGRPLLHILNMSEGTISFYPITPKECSVRMTVFRFPLSELSELSLDIVPEISTKYHKWLIYGIISKATAKEDIDTFNEKSQFNATMQWRKCIDDLKREKINLIQYPNINTIRQGFF